MAVITIDGIRGALQTGDIEQTAALAQSLLESGYDLHVNGLRVGLCYGPGYNTVNWREGDYEGGVITETVNPDMATETAEVIECDCAAWHTEECIARNGRYDVPDSYGPVSA